MKKQVLGYGYRIASESLKESLCKYYLDQAEEDLTLLRTPKRVKELIKFDEENGIVTSNSKKKIFKVTIEEIE